MQSLRPTRYCATCENLYMNEAPSRYQFNAVEIIDIHVESTDLLVLTRSIKLSEATRDRSPIQFSAYLSLSPSSTSRLNFLAVPTLQETLRSEFCL